MDTNKLDTLTLVIGKYHTRSFSPTGRGTIGYIAYVVGKGQLVFMKDTWRGVSSGIPTELCTYTRLYALGVQHIAEIVGGGDVEHTDRDGHTDHCQYTQTQAYLPLREPEVVRRQHFRLVTETLGLPLIEHKHSLALVHVIRDAVHGEAASCSAFPYILTLLTSSLRCMG